MRRLCTVISIPVLLLNAACIFDSDPEPRHTPIPDAPAGRGAGAALATSSATPAQQSSGDPPTGLVSVQYTLPFVWPSDGPITSFMGPEHPDGIDIGLDVVETLDIRASAGGIVTAARGSDEEPLGLSIIIDHGNGVTTTYGHLSELLVEEGDEVAIGELIGIGGSTGHSTGDHLHFEVRKHGLTVDPLDVLPEDRIDSRISAVDCETVPIVVPAGSLVRIDFRGIAAAGGELATVRAIAFNDGPRLEPVVEARSTVRLVSAIDFDTPDGQNQYNLAVTLDGAAENRVLSCVLVVEGRSVPTTFYVRAAPAEGEEEAPEEAVVEPTPTPNPWPQGPSYTLPASSATDAQSPTYGAPSGSGVVVQSPSYGFPGQEPTPGTPD